MVGWISEIKYGEVHQMLLSKFSRGVLSISLLVGIGGCASQPMATTKDMSLEQIKAIRESAAAALKDNDLKVDALLAKGKTDDAVELLKQATEKYPENKEPWNRLAKMYFDDGDYGEAIEAADEVLELDESDQSAKVIRAVSGLRVASQSLVDLRDDANLQGSARADAVSLVKVLRETLGEDVLLPTDKTRIKDRDSDKSKKSRYKKKQYTHRPVPEDKKEANSAPAMNGDPFSVLR
jgi:tetratricopeptide (TPR) repeat protein